MPRAHELWDKYQMTEGLCNKRSPKCPGEHRYSSRLRVVSTQSMGLTGTQPVTVVTHKVQGMPAHIFLYSAFFTDWEYMSLI